MNNVIEVRTRISKATNLFVQSLLYNYYIMFALAEVAVASESLLRVVMMPSSGWLNYGCVSGGGATQTWGMRQNTAFGHLLVVPPGNDSLGVWTIPTTGADG
jgi:hypothetical protein